jgi:hypothetical protein
MVSAQTAADGSPRITCSTNPSGSPSDLHSGELAVVVAHAHVRIVDVRAVPAPPLAAHRRRLWEHGRCLTHFETCIDFCVALRSSAAREDGRCRR